MGKNRRHIACFECKPVPARQRVEPDNLPRGKVQPLHLSRQIVLAALVKPVSDQQHHRPLPHDPPRHGVGNIAEHHKIGIARPVTLVLSAVTSPPCRMAARIVRRQSSIAPRRQARIALLGAKS